MYRQFIRKTAVILMMVSICFVSTWPSISLSSPSSFESLAQHNLPENSHLFLQGFKPDTQVTFLVLSNRGDILSETVSKVDDSGNLILKRPENISGKHNKIIYSLRLFHPHGVDKSFLFRHDLRSGKMSLIGQGLSELSKVQIITDNQKFETKTDWSGRFNETDIITNPYGHINAQNSVLFKLVLDLDDLNGLKDSLDSLDDLGGADQLLGELGDIQNVKDLVGDLGDVADIVEVMHEAKAKLESKIRSNAEIYDMYDQYEDVLDDFQQIEELSVGLEALEKFDQLEDTIKALDTLGDLDNITSVVNAVTDPEELAEALENAFNIENPQDLGEITDALSDIADLGEVTDALKALETIDLGNLKESFKDFADLSELSGLAGLDNLAELAQLDNLASAIGDIADLGDFLDVFGDIGDIFDLGGFSAITLFSGLGGGGPFGSGVNSFIGGSSKLSTGNKSAMKQHIEDIKGNYVTALMLMTEQLNAVSMSSTAMIGQFFDAKQQLETQRLYQELSAEAHKDYHPSEQMCRFGSYVRSLATVEQKSLHEKNALNEMLMQRYTNNRGSSTRFGAKYDMEARLEEYRTVYCDLSDNGGGENMMFICDRDQDFSTSSDKGGEDPERFNKDIDYMATLELPGTLDIDFTDPSGEATADEQDVMALARNLYWPSAFEMGDVRTLNKRTDTYLKLQRVKALSGVAHASFAHLVGMKAKAPDPTGGLQPGWSFMKTFMREFGMSDEDIDKMYGENPSYWAQMEILTKKIYQSPNFYTNLYDKPVNLDRIEATLGAIQLMQLRDYYTSHTRSEMLQSAMLELELEQGKHVSRVKTDLLKIKVIVD